MLILEIALGILLGFLLINSLPALMLVGGWALLIGISLTGDILLATLVYFTFTEFYILYLLIAAIVGVFGLHKWYSVRYSDLIAIRELEKQISQKEKLGYNMDKERKRVQVLRETYQTRNNKVYSSNQVGKVTYFRRYKSEEERRKALGYDN